MTDTDEKRTSCVVKAVLRVPVLILCAVFALAATASALVRVTVADRSFFVSTLSSPEYTAELGEYIDDELETYCLIYGFPYENAKGAVNADTLQTLCTEYADSLFTAFTESGEAGGTSPDPAIFRTVVDFYAEESGAPMLAGDESRAQLSELLCEVLSDSLNALGGGTMISAPHGFYETARLMYSGYLCAASSVLALVMAAIYFLLTPRPRMFSSAYILSGVLFCVFSLLFTPFFVLTVRNTVGLLPIAYSPLAICVKAFAEALVGKCFAITLTLSSAAFVLTVLFAVLHSLPARHKTEVRSGNSV